MTLAEFEELEFIDSGDSEDECPDPIRRVSVRQHPARPISYADSHRPISFTDTNLNHEPLEYSYERMAVKDGLSTSTHSILESDHSAEEPIKMDDSYDRNDLNELPMKCEHSVIAEVHCDCDNNVANIDSDLRTSLSDCSQPISTSDTVDSGIHISQSEESFNMKNSHSKDDSIHSFENVIRTLGRLSESSPMDLIEGVES